MRLSMYLMTGLVAICVGAGCESASVKDPNTGIPGDTDSGDTDPGDVDPGDTDPGDVDPGDTDPGDTDSSPSPPTEGLQQTGSQGKMSSSTNKANVVVGSPQPSGSASSEGHKLRAGPSLNR